MYARLATFPVKGVSRAEADEFAEEANRAFQNLRGFKQAIYLANDDVSEVCALSLWESREAATEHNDALRALVLEGMDEHLAGDPVIRIYEVYEK